MVQNTNKGLQSLLSQIKAMGTEKITATSTMSGHSTYSFGIVCSKDNGKRVTLSKALASRLNIEDNFDVIAQPQSGKLYIGKDLQEIDENSSTFKLCGNNKKYCYNAELVLYLISAYELDFKERTSRSFSNITFDTHNNNPVGIILLNPTLDNAVSLAVIEEDQKETVEEVTESVATSESEEDDGFVFDEYEDEDSTH